VGKPRITSAREQGADFGPALIHSSALKISPTISHQPTSAKARPELRATAISAIRR
jgi:hypothetical protein